jgi:hypothetical protein
LGELSLIRHLWVPLGLSIALLVPGLGTAGGDDPESILVYTGNGALNEGYVNFGAAAGKVVVVDAVFPADLAPHECVVLPINAVAFDGVQTAALVAYVAGGGRLFVVGERSAFPEAVASLNGVLDALGVKQIAAVGEHFDPHVHEAVVTEATDEYEPDTVMQEIVAGYRLGDKLIRPALVKVATRK